MAAVDLDADAALVIHEIERHVAPPLCARKPVRATLRRASFAGDVARVSADRGNIGGTMRSGAGATTFPFRTASRSASTAISTCPA